MLARKLRADPRFRSLALIAVTPQPDTLPGRNAYDGLLTRTFVPETFKESFSKLLAICEQASLLADGSPVVKQMVLAAFQVCHMRLGTDVVIDDNQAVDEAASRRWCRAAVEVHTRGGAIDLRVLASYDTARALTGRCLESDPRRLGERDLLDTLREIAGTLSETLNQTLTRRGLPSGCGVPRAECLTSVGLPPIADGQEYVQFALLALSDGSRLVIRLARLTGGSAIVTETTKERAGPDPERHGRQRRAEHHELPTPWQSIATSCRAAGPRPRAHADPDELVASVATLVRRRPKSG